MINLEQTIDNPDLYECGECYWKSYLNRIPKEILEKRKSAYHPYDIVYYEKETDIPIMGLSSEKYYIFNLIDEEKLVAPRVVKRIAYSEVGSAIFNYELLKSVPEYLDVVFDEVPIARKLYIKTMLAKDYAQNPDQDYELFIKNHKIKGQAEIMYCTFIIEQEYSQDA